MVSACSNTRLTSANAAAAVASGSSPETSGLIRRPINPLG